MSLSEYETELIVKIYEIKELLRVLDLKNKQYEKMYQQLDDLQSRMIYNLLDYNKQDVVSKKSSKKRTSTKKTNH